MPTKLAEGLDLFLGSPGINLGVNLRDAADQVSLAEALDLNNVLLDWRGGVIKRAGSTTKVSLVSGTYRVLSQYVFYRGASAAQHIVHMSDGSVKYSTDLSTYTNIWTGLSTSAPFTYETFNGKVYMSNGVDDYRWWDGAAAGSNAAFPKFKYIRLWKDTMWGTGISGNPTIVQSSAASDAETWPASNFIYINKDDGHINRGLYVAGDVLLVFKENEYHMIYDPAEFSNRLVDPDNGIVSHWAVEDHNNVILFMSKNGICAHTDSGAQIVSGRIEPLFTSGLLNTSALDQVIAYQHQNRIGFSVPEAGQSVPTMQIEVYPTLEGLPIAFQRMPMKNAVLWTDGSLLYGRTDTNKVMVGFNGATDDGAAYSSLIRTGWFNFGSSLYRKYLRELRIHGFGDFYCTVLRDFNDSGIKTMHAAMSASADVWDSTNDVWGVGTWGSATGIQDKTFHADSYGRHFSLVFLDNASGVDNRYIQLAGVRKAIPTGRWGLVGWNLHALLLGDRA